MALFQSAGRLPLFIVMSSNRARYGIMASPPVLGLLQKYRHALLFVFYNRCYSFSNDFRVYVEGFAFVGTLYMLDFTLSAEHRRVVEIKRICLIYRIYDRLTITVFDDRNIFLRTFTPLYVLVGNLYTYDVHWYAIILIIMQITLVQTALRHTDCFGSHLGCWPFYNMADTRNFLIF